MEKEKGSRANASPKNNSHPDFTTRIEFAITLGVWALVEREGTVRLSALRAMARDFATRREVLRALNELSSARALTVSADATGPIIEVRRGGAR